MTRIKSSAACITGIFALILSASCSGDGTSPIRVHHVLVTPTDTTVLTGQTVQLEAETTDALGNVLNSKPVTWSSGDEAIATVSESGLVTGHAPGSVTITATSEEKTGWAIVEVETAPFEPTSDVTVSGALRYASVNVPAGVKVTLAADVTFDVHGPVAIDGALEGNCVAISIHGANDVSIGGRIDNSCATPGAAAPGIVIVGQGSLDVDGAEMRSSGHIRIANDPAISTEPGIPTAGPLTGFAGGVALDGPYPCDIRNYTVVTGVVPAAAGANGQHGADGANGSGFVLACNGDMSFRGNVQIETQAGGAGGKGAHESGTAANATGGDGGSGGILLLRARGDMSFTHETAGQISNQFFSGSGGAGGDAEAEGLSNPTPDQAPGATSAGGHGGAGGGVRLEVQGRLTAAAGSFYAGPGLGGEGGEATAIGADGAHAAARLGPAQAGGSASATGGLGGDAAGFTWVATDGVTGVNNLVFDDAADAGPGGEASARAGAGGDGDENDSNGAVGGPVTAVGGNGGDAHSGFGGAGGSALLGGARGGNGWNGCVDPTAEVGGSGGGGGAATGRVGIGGPGLNPGADGDVYTDDVSNGGDGGDGDGPGAGGAAGAAAITASSPIVELGTGSFQDGEPGNDCGDTPDPGFALTLNGSYLHFDGFSRVCLRVESDPGQPNAPFQATVTGPGVAGSGAHSGTLNGAGVATAANDISAYGSYVWTVSVGNREAQTTINVTAAPGTGDC